MRSTPNPVIPPPPSRGRFLARAGAGVIALTGLLCLAVVPSASADAALQFPFEATFDDGSGGDRGGSATLDSGWLRLTAAEIQQAGSWSTTDAFPSTLGLDITFDYAAYGTPAGRDAGDGIAFYLADGAAPDGTGAIGAALGYSCKGPGEGVGACTTPGVPGAYLGIGLDEFGRFSTALNGSGPGKSPNTIVVRGSGNGLTGYDYRLGAMRPEGLGTGSRAGARTVRVLVEPSGGRMKFSLFVNTGGDSPLEPVFENVDVTDWAGQAALPSTLRLGFTGSTGNARSVHEIDNLSVNVPTDLSIAKSGPAGVAAGDRLSWQVVARNQGANDALGATISDTLPAGVSDVSWTCRAEVGSTCVEDSGAGPILTAHADLPAATGAVTYTVTGRVDPAAMGSLTNTASIAPPADRSDVDPDNDTASATTAVETRAELTTTKAFSLLDGAKGSVTPGGEFTYTVTAHNAGPSSAHAVGTTDLLPEGITFVSSANGCTAAGRQVTCSSDATVAADGAKAFTFRVRLDAGYSGDGSDLPNVGIATSDDDPDGATPSGPVTIPVGPARAELTTGKKAVLPEAGFVRPGDRFGYELTAVNHGPSAAREVGVVDDLPVGLRFVEGDSGCAARGQKVTCSSTVALGPGEAKVFRLNVELEAKYRGDGSDLGNVAVATSPTDPDGAEESPRVFVPVRVEAAPTPTPTLWPTPSASPTGGAAGGPASGSGARPAPSMLAFTGTTIVAGALSLAVLLAAAGSTFLVVARRRRGRSSSAGD